ncbi:hypothetical protein HD599_001637 [Conyzicola lurida]|uniref:DNA-binding protein n=1 Tax=Conyzicola lurida TaxID=1172621 RepID=A0A841ALS8_9MICO|nr:hypothetical protein [Conyzicola lurida]MBB5843314.1 hypothetical protein [Conyzicola lurida]
MADDPDPLSLDAVAGPWYEPGTVAEKLGVTVDEVERLVHEGDAWAITTSDGFMLLPVRQFRTGEGFGLLPAAGEVMRAMVPSRGHGRDDEEAVYWLFWSRGPWGDGSAFDLIVAGRIPEVLKVVERLPDLG